MAELVVSQGRVGDRTAGAIPGALVTEKALRDRTGRALRIVGRPTAPAEDDWRQSLPIARETLLGLREAVTESLDAGHVPVMLANTCAASLATLPVAAERHPEAVVLWIDAHGDFNTPETTASGYLGGMVLAAACGLWDSGHGAGLDPRRVILVGARDIDVEERRLLDHSGVTILPPGESTAARLASLVGDREVWIHIDWDVLEPGYVPAAYRVPDGLSPTQVERVLGALSPGRVAGVEIAEFEATGAAADDDQAVATILRTVEPLVSVF